MEAVICKLRAVVHVVAPCDYSVLAVSPGGIRKVFGVDGRLIHVILYWDELSAAGSTGSSGTEG